MIAVLPLICVCGWVAERETGLLHFLLNGGFFLTHSIEEKKESGSASYDLLFFPFPVLCSILSMEYAEKRDGVKERKLKSYEKTLRKTATETVATKRNRFLRRRGVTMNVR